MIQLKTYLNCIDNSGAAVVECAKVLRMKRHASIGDRIIVVVQKQRSFGPESGPGGSVSTSAANKVRRGDIRHAVVVRTAKKIQRSDGSVVKFDDNACVLINKAGEPIGTRLNGELLTFSLMGLGQHVGFDHGVRYCWAKRDYEPYQEQGGSVVVDDGALANGNIL
ncbi:MAG: hypothetical protein M1827_002679 [Pycnora praestabilis]|nr:MAG: hypothetical protein M1827_002679 [Pycnora praestabilis]